MVFKKETSRIIKFNGTKIGDSNYSIELYVNLTDEAIRGKFKGLVGYNGIINMNLFAFCDRNKIYGAEAKEFVNNIIRNNSIIEFDLKDVYTRLGNYYIDYEKCKVTIKG
ncbi:hypothetical protein D3C81_09760 [compost metagenome]